MANFFDQFDAEKEKELEPSQNFFDQFDAPAKKKATGPKGKDTKQLPEDDETGNLMRGIYNYLPQFQETYGGAKVFAGLGLKKLGATDTGQELIESGAETKDIGESKQVTKESDSLSRAWEMGIGTVVTDWLPYNIGSGIANIGETLAVMGVGAGIGAVMGAGVGAIPSAAAGVISKTLVKKGIKEAAEAIIENEAKKVLAEGATKQVAKTAGEAAGAAFIEAQSKNVLLQASEMAVKAYGKIGAKSYGATAGMVGQAGLHGMGETTARAIDEAEKEGIGIDDINYGRLATAAAVHSVADFFINKIGLGALKIGEGASKSLALDIGKRIGVTGLKEIPAEEIQTMAERYGANLSLTDAEALREYIDTAGAAFAMSVAPGAVGGAKTHYVNKLLKAGADAEVEGLTRQGDLTVNKDAPPPLTTGFSKETADLLAPATDAAGNPLVADTARPDITEITPPPPAPKKVRAAKISSEGVTPESIQAANDYIGKIDSGETIKQSEYRQIARPIGLSIPVGKTNAEAVELIRQHLAQQGAPDAKGIDIDTGGAGTTVAALTDTGQAAAGTDGTQPGGVVSTGATTGTNLAGTVQQSIPLIRGTVTPAVVSSLTDEQLSREVANSSLTDSEYALLRYEQVLRQQGITSGSETSQTQQTTAQGQAATTAGTTVTPPTTPTAGFVNIDDIVPEVRESVIARRDEVYELVNDGAPAHKITKAYKTLNALEESLGLEKSEPFNLSAKRDEDGHIIVKSIVKEGGQAKATEQDRTPAYQGTDTRAAMELADKYEKEAEAERTRLYQESLRKGESRYDQDKLPPNTEENYNAVAEEINTKAKAANEIRGPLVTAFEAADKAYRAAVNEAVNIETAIETAERNKDQQRVETLSEQENEVNPQESDLFGKLEDAQKALQKHGPVQNQLKPWYKLTAADKDIYFGYIRNNTPAEHRQAAAALLDAKNKAGIQSREGEGKMDATERRISQNYEDNRAQMGKIFGVQFPLWNKLSTAAKAVFLKELGVTSKEEVSSGRSVNISGLQQDYAFAELGVKLNTDNRTLSETERQKDTEAIEKQKREVRVTSERKRRLDQRLKRDYSRYVAPGIGSGFNSLLPDKIVQLIKENNLQGVLQYLRTMPEVGSGPAVQGRQIAKTVANVIFNMGLKTKIRIVPSLPNEDLAIYDPVADEILVTVDGLSGSTILHEAVHAATVKILSHFVAGRFNRLTPSQLAAARQLQSIMERTKSDLGRMFPNHYASLLEFVSYALTDAAFQAALNDVSVNVLTDSELVGFERFRTAPETKGLYGSVPEKSFTSSLPNAKKAWTAFKLAMAKIFVVGSTINEKTGAVKSITLANVMFNKDGTVSKTAPTNLLMEISAAFDDILAVPTEPIYLPKLSAKKPSTPKEAKFQTSGLYEEDKSYNLSNKEKHGLDVEGDISKIGRVKRAFSRYGWRDFVTKAQNRRHHIRAYENELAMAGLLKRDPTGAFNNISEQQDLALNQGVRYAIDYLQQPLKTLHELMDTWQTQTSQTTEAGLLQFHKLGEMFGATERRFAKWIMSVPLSTIKNLTHNGKPISAAERRIALVGDPRTGVDGLIHKVALNDQQKAAIRKELEYLATNHADAFGDSPRITEKMSQRFAKNAKHKGIDTDKNAPIYNALGIEEDTVNKRMAEFLAKSPEEQALIKQIFAQIKIITDATAELNKIGNYWSMPVSNIVGIYNYQYYMPFKGLSKHTKMDDMIDPNSKMNGAEHQDEIHSAEGRFSTSDNPLLQTIYDGYRAASRAGRKNFTQSIENAVEPTTSKEAYNPTGTGVLPGRVVKTVYFWQRDTVDLSKYKGANSKYMFNYKPDGSFNIIAIDNPRLLHAIRYPFQEKSPLWDAANRVTGFFGSMHTRFNYNFAPKDFVVNTLTYAWSSATNEIVGPLGAAAYLKDVAMSVVRNGLGKAMNIAVLHEVGSAGSKKIMSDMAKKDSFVRDMLEMIRYGGKSTYMESFSLKSNLENLSQNSFGKNNIITDPISATKLLDSWNNMFEFTSRTAMYSLYKERVLKKNIDSGMSDKKGPNGELSPAERAAATEAAAFTLNLANFSQQGEWGKIMGGLYMFSKPSSTGAVRALEAVLPAFTSVERAMQNLPPAIENNPTAKAKYEETFRQRQFNARVMTTTLISSGMGLFGLSMMGAPDDEWERNAARTDNMEQWARYARFHIPNEVSERLGLGKDIVFQIPWGFGPGAFASAGAQFASMLAGTITPLEAFSNITFTIMTDAFLPLPISKIPITDTKTAVLWAVDSAMPTVVRPVIEWLANVNGVGQAINSASQRRMGDAYTSGDRIPEIYKDVADGIYESTHGALDLSPNTMYFFTNSYLDGVAKIAELAYSWTNLGKGEKEFNPKTDLPLFGSFFGSKTNVDSREYGKMEQEIKEIDSRLYTLEKRNPALLAEFVAENPFYPIIVEEYKKAQGELNELRKKATEIRNNKYIDIKDRDALIKITILEQNMLKHRLVMDFKAMGLKR